MFFDHVTLHRLPNGLEVVLGPDRSAPVISFHTWYRVGSRHEVDGKTGIAHLFEHLMFNQTANLEAGEFDRLVEAAGGDTNAATWVDWTYYRDNLPADRLELAVRLEADRMQHLTLTERQVESEREVVMNERRFRVDDDVEGFLGEELFRLAFDRHPYRNPTIGWMRDIEALSTDDCLAFYRTFYAPNNATLILVGDFEPARALELIERGYGKIPPASIQEPAWEKEPAPAGERRAVFSKPVSAERAIFAWRSPPQGDPDWLALAAVNELLLGGASARLYRELVTRRELASQAQGMLAPLRDEGLYEIFVGMKKDTPARSAEELVDGEIARLVAEPISDGEIAKVKNRMLTETWSELETADGKAEALGQHRTTLGDHRLLFDLPARIGALTSDDLRRAASRWLVPAGRTIVVAEPSGEEESGEDE